MKKYMYSFISSSFTFVKPLLTYVGHSTNENHFTENYLRQIIQSSGKLLMSSLWQFFQCLPCILSLNKQIAQAVITAAFESIQWDDTHSFVALSCLILPDMIKTIKMYGKACNQIFFHLNPLYSHRLLH